MGSCQECGGKTALNFPLCRLCWSRHKSTIDAKEGVGSTVSVLAVSCDYEGCKAAEGEECRLSEFTIWGHIRVICAPSKKLEVHETRFRKWRSPVIAG